MSSPSETAPSQEKLARRPVGAHPAATLFPMLHGVALGELSADIESNGLREPIVLHEGLVLDGRNRLRGCELAGIEPRFVEWDGQGSPVGFVLSRNLHRRHLNESQRAIVAARAKNLFEEEAAKRQAAGLLRGNDRPESDGGKDMQKAHEFPVGANLHQRGSRANEEAAALLNVSPRSVATASKVLDRAEPEVVSAVESGNVAVSDAASIVALSPKEQRQAIERVNCGEATTLRQAARRRRRNADDATDDDDAARTPAEREQLSECRKIGKGLAGYLRRLERIGHKSGRAKADCDHMVQVLDQLVRYLHAALARWMKPTADSDSPSARR